MNKMSFSSLFGVGAKDDGDFAVSDSYDDII